VTSVNEITLIGFIIATGFRNTLIDSAFVTIIAVNRGMRTPSLIITAIISTSIIIIARYGLRRASSIRIT